MEKDMIWIVGFGPGDRRHMTIEAQEAMQSADVIVGYSGYNALKIGRAHV